MTSEITSQVEVLEQRIQLLRAALVLEHQESATRVRRAVAELPRNQRIAVSLLRFHDLSYEEIGRAMNLTVQAVKSLLNRAKENLRRALAADLGSALEASPERAAKGIA